MLRGMVGSFKACIRVTLKEDCMEYLALGDNSETCSWWLTPETKLAAAGR